MKVLYENSFLKDIEKLTDKKILNRLSEIIEKVKSIHDLQALPNLKKLKGHSSAYRVRIGDYRLGFFSEKDTVRTGRICINFFLKTRRN
jgi:mRNA interferase RelE/StbE